MPLLSGSSLITSLRTKMLYDNSQLKDLEICVMSGTIIGSWKFWEADTRRVLRSLREDGSLRKKLELLIKDSRHNDLAEAAQAVLDSCNYMNI
jgi:hypothetical protein